MVTEMNRPSRLVTLDMFHLHCSVALEEISLANKRRGNESGNKLIRTGSTTLVAMGTEHSHAPAALNIVLKVDQPINIETHS